MGKTFKIAIIILSVMLCISVITNIVLGFRIPKLNVEILKQKSIVQFYKDMYHNDLKELEKKYQNENSELEKTLDEDRKIIYKYQNKIPLSQHEEYKAYREASQYERKNGLK